MEHSQAFPADAGAAIELSNSICRARQRGFVWRRIADDYSITRVEALRLCHDLNGVIGELTFAEPTDCVPALAP